MKTMATLAAVLSLSIAAAGHAAADSNHGHGSGPLVNDSRPSAGQGEMMQDMMRMMMQMHGQMMGAGPGSGMSMMDGDMMRMMMGPGMMGGPNVSPMYGMMHEMMRHHIMMMHGGRSRDAEGMDMRKGMHKDMQPQQ